ncbi:hypothetical protein P7C73_g5329, partial [Tremellales sp. Uapishka_1]
MSRTLVTHTLPSSLQPSPMQAHNAPSIHSERVVIENPSPPPFSHGSYFPPQQESQRESSAPLSSIGNLLSAMSDTDDEDDYKPSVQKAEGRPRVGSISQAVATANGVPRVRSHEGEIDERPRTIIDFPDPMLTPAPRYPSRTHDAYNPQRPIPPETPYSPRPSAPHHLPPPSSPISPMLAAPPSLFTPPRSPFASPGVDNRASVASTTDSIRAFDIMKEKRALFREGQEDIMVPFSPRPRAKDGKRATRMSRMFGLGGTPTSGDFWKRYSTSVRLDEVARSAGDK